MAAIRSADTQPEMIVRRLLHRAGFRYRLHRKDLPGKPDLTLKKWKAVIQVHGCFFHAHGCHMVRRPPSDNAEFWTEKLSGNAARDLRNAEAIAVLGWRQLVVWQCAITGKSRLARTDLLDIIADWLWGTDISGEIRGSD
jgi:DNA mismatch endonuclease (patch repair protein)